MKNESDTKSGHEALTELGALLAAPHSMGSILAWVLGRTPNTSGTIHLMGPDGLLHLTAQEGLPGEVLAAIDTIPVGKGMAGLAAERRIPVSLCNLQTDTSGDARPGARATGLRGTVALPLLDGDGRVVGVLGVGRPQEHTFAGPELDLLLAISERIARAASTGAI